MTPKEKAIELVQKFNYDNKHFLMYDAKQCALICVDEMLKPIFLGGKRYDRTLVEILFLQEVKQEIKKL